MAAAAILKTVKWR